MIYAIVFVSMFLLIIIGVIYIIRQSWKNFEPSKIEFYGKHKTKKLGPGHGIQTPYGTASSNGAASAYVARTRNK